MPGRQRNLTVVTKPSTSPKAFFQEVVTRFRRAESSVDCVHDHYYNVAGATIRLRFAGDALLPIITPALSHLRLAEPPSAEPALTLLLWDVASTGVNLPHRPWAEDDHISRGDIRGFDDADVRTAYTLGPNTLSMLQTQQRLGVFCTTSAAHISTDYRGSPLLVILSWWTSERGLQYVHAAAVGLAEAGVLIVGKGGSGKSTSALACIESNLHYAADDYCLVDTRQRQPFVHSIYNSAKLDGNHIRHLPHLVPLISNSEHLDKDKAVIYLHDHLPGKIAHGFPIKAVLIPRITGRPDTKLVPASRLAGLQALAPSTLFQLSGADANNFRTMAELVRRVPSQHLELGTDLKQIPAVIDEYLTEP